MEIAAFADVTSEAEAIRQQSPSSAARAKKPSEPRFDACSKPMLILCAGEFGTTKSAAEATTRRAEGLHFNASLKEPNDVEALDLTSYGLVVGVIATYNGNPTLDATALVAEVQALAEQSVGASFEGVKFAILAWATRTGSPRMSRLGGILTSAWRPWEPLG